VHSHLCCLKTVAYIRNQEEHHKRISFADEFKKFLATHGMAGGEMIQPSLPGLSAMMNNFPTIGFGPVSLAVPVFGGPNHGGLLSCVPFGDSGQALSGLIAQHTSA
jgi:hypothetical protein